MLSYRLNKTINHEALQRAGVCALDIEMADWRVPAREWISLVQVAYRVATEIVVIVLDGKETATQAAIHPILSNPAIKVVAHNASYDINNTGRSKHSRPFAS